MNEWCMVSIPLRLKSKYLISTLVKRYDYCMTHILYKSKLELLFWCIYFIEKCTLPLWTVDTTVLWAPERPDTETVSSLKQSIAWTPDIKDGTQKNYYTLLFHHIYLFLISNLHISDMYTNNCLYYILCFCFFVHCLFVYLYIILYYLCPVLLLLLSL